MARPPLQTGLAKDKVLTVRVTGELHEELERLRHQMAAPVELSMGQVLRAVIERGIDAVRKKP